MLVKTFDQKGKKIGQTRLPKEIFGVALNEDLVHQVIVAQRANRRQGTAHTKNRGEVRGGGRKPWRQKGTGRARAGSIRSPIWKGGGVAFGPTKERVFRKRIPKKMRRKALLMVLSAKVKNDLLIVLDKLKLDYNPPATLQSQPAHHKKEAPATHSKTKWLVDILKKLPCKGKSCLIALPKMDKSIILSARNIPKVKTVQAEDLNSLDLLSFQYLILPKESLKVIKETFLTRH